MTFVDHHVARSQSSARRSAAARVKRDISRGVLLVQDAVYDERVEHVNVLDLLASRRRVSRVKAARELLDARVPAVPVRALTGEERRRLVRRLAGAAALAQGEKGGDRG